MSSGFSNPIVAGLKLLIQAIQSPDFVTEVSGWSINKDGSAEFNNLTVRGTFFGTDYVINADGLFFYNGAPAAGNLMLSLTPAAGTDGFGNAYDRGFAIYNGGPSIDHIDAVSGFARFGSAAGAHFILDPSVEMFEVYNSAAQNVINIDAARQALFIYSGTPTHGNLLVSIANNAGTDPNGNTYPEGLSFTAGGKSVVIGLTGGSPLIFFVSGLAAIANSSAIQDIILGTGTSAVEFLQIISAQDSTQNDLMLTGWQSSSADGTQNAQITDQYKDAANGFHKVYSADVSGAKILAGSVTAVAPGTGTRATPATPEAWHTPSLAAGFTTNAADQVPRYRMEGIAGGVVRLDGVVYTASASIAAGTTIFTLPAGYRPTQRKRFSGLNNFASYAAGNASVMVQPSGAVTTAVATGTGTGLQLCLDGIEFPID